MTHRYLYSILAALLIAGSSAAQDSQTLQALNERDIMGTARYVGMSGAMTAVGGDPSAVADNPAALGVYRHMEVGLTFDMQIDRTWQVPGNNTLSSANRFTVNQASWVFTFGDDRYTEGLIYSNLMLSYRCIRSFNRGYYGSARNQTTSLTDVILNKTDGLHASALVPAGRWDDNEVGWLSILGYDTWLISPQETDSTAYTSVLSEGDLVNNELTVRESGNVNQYAIHWAGNINNRLFIGVGLNIQSLAYNRTATYRESFDGDWLKNASTVYMNGVGLNGSVGLIWHPVRLLRIGASFESPSINQLTVTNYGTMSSALKQGGAVNSYQLETPYYTGTQNNFVMPLRSSVGLAFQCKSLGLLSLQYDYTHWRNMDDVHTLKLGLEARYLGWYINAGYAYESTFRRDEPIQELAYNSVRTDTHFRNILATHYASAGVGYRGHWCIAQLAYQFRWQAAHLYPHELAEPYDITANTHRIVLTLAWHH